MSLFYHGVNIYVLYRIIRSLATPFDETKAYELGIIDSDGKILKKRSELETEEEKDAYTLFDTFIFNIKRLLSHIPGGKSKLATYAAALYLLKENRYKNGNIDYNMLKEEIANSVGSGTNFGTDKPVKMDSMVRRTKFGDKDVFIVDPNTYYSLLKPKPKYHKYRDYIGSDEVGKEISKFARENPGKDILIQNDQTKFLKYLKTNIRMS